MRTLILIFTALLIGCSTTHYSTSEYTYHYDKSGRYKGYTIKSEANYQYHYSKYGRYQGYSK